MPDPPALATAVAAKRSASESLRITHRCPRCGAPAVLEETEHVLRCAYCRVSSCLLPGETPRYLLGAGGGASCPGRSAADQGAASVLWFPYWRLRGTLFTMSAGGDIAHRHVDANLPAASAPGFPPSLGVRPQAMPLAIVAADTPGRFVQPGILAGNAARAIAHRFAPEGEIAARDFIGESVSLIYAPFGVGAPGAPRALVDLVSGKPTGAVLDETQASRLVIDREPPPGASFVPATCPHCAGDLDGGSHALVFTCLPCGTRWLAGPRGLEPVSYSTLGDAANAAVVIPFWRFGGNGAEYWSPAIKLRPAALLRIAAVMTLEQPGAGGTGARTPDGREIPGIPGGLARVPVVPVTLSREEAANSAPWVMASIRYVPAALARGLDALRHAPPTAAAARLVYVPFREGPLQYENPGLGLAIERGAVAMGAEM